VCGQPERIGVVGCAHTTSSQASIISTAFRRFLSSKGVDDPGGQAAWTAELVPNSQGVQLADPDVSSGRVSWFGENTPTNSIPSKACPTTPPKPTMPPATGEQLPGRCGRIR
jgi:hypothetical protein